VYFLYSDQLASWKLYTPSQAMSDHYFEAWINLVPRALLSPRSNWKKTRERTLIFSDFNVDREEALRTRLGLDVVLILNSF